MKSYLGIAIAKLLTPITFPGQDNLPPSAVLLELIQRAGWTVREGPVPGRRLAMCDAWRKVIWMDHRFEQGVRVRSKVVQIRSQRIAHEFGHGFLHAAALRQGRRTP